MFFQIIELFFVINSISPPQKHFEGHATIAESSHRRYCKIYQPTPTIP